MICFVCLFVVVSVYLPVWLSSCLFASGDAPGPLSRRPSTTSPAHPMLIPTMVITTCGLLIWLPVHLTTQKEILESQANKIYINTAMYQKQN